MNDTAVGMVRPSGRGHDTPGDLHIYYFEGRFPAGTPMPEAGFLGNWEEADTCFLFFARPADEDVRRLVAAAHGAVTLCDAYTMTYAEWQGQVPPVQHIGGFRVVTPWASPPEGDALTLTIDPGVVFGTGQHPTTHDCLTALDLAFARHPIGRMMDLGTGTGILAVAGAALGCPRVLAIDLNALAAQTARRNVTANAFQDRVAVAVADARAAARWPADLMVANIHYAVMREMAGDREAMSGKRAFILSGLLRGEAKDIRFVLGNMGVSIIREWHRDGIWFTFYAERR